MSDTTPVSLSGGIRLEVARERIDAFSEFGLPHLYFAQHAAFPMSLTVDLLYRLWANFLRDISGEQLHIPWIAVSDLLLSSLCDEVGHELYEMDVTVRAELLRGLQANPGFGQPRIRELSYFLLDYVQQQLHSSKAGVRTFAEAQQWTVLAYIQPGRVARELAESLKALEQKNKVEQIRLVSLMETLNTLAPPLSAQEGFTPLLTYARGVERVARGDIEGAKAQFSEVKAVEQIEQAVGVRLPGYEGLLEAHQASAPSQQAPGTPATPDTPTTRKDFLISYHSADTNWANWIAWQLEEAGYVIELQTWNFQPEADFTAEVDRVEQLAKHLIVILSPDYLSALASMPAWVDAFLRDPRNGPDFIVAFHVRECRATLARTLGIVDYTDVVGLYEEAAHEALLDRISRLHDTPSLPSGVIYHSLTLQPAFPGTSPVTTKTDQAVEVFYSYSQRDERFREELDQHLAVLKQQGLIVTWHYQMMTAGAEWEYEINRHLNTAQVILLLISPDFLASTYAYSIEMRRALERQEAGEALVIPILLRPVDGEYSPFWKLRALPENGRPVSTWTNRDEAFIDVVQGIRRAIEQFTGRSVVEAEASQEIEVQQREEGDARIYQRMAEATLLWVDDHPENNVSERKAMEAAGIRITLSQSTEDALQKVRERTYDVIISDMGRQPAGPQPPYPYLYDDFAGYTLLDKLRDQHIFTPFIIYTSSSSAKDQAETRRRGGFGTTSDPEELFQMVIDAIEQSVNPTSAKAETVVKKGTEDIGFEGVEDKSERAFSEVAESVLERREEVFGRSAVEAEVVSAVGAGKEDDVLARAYNMVRVRKITNPETIRAIATRFDAIARDPASSLNYPYDAARAAQSLYDRVRYHESQITEEQRKRADNNQALSLNLDDLVASITQGDDLYSHRDFSAALDKYEQAISLDPNNAYSYLGKAMVLASLNRYADALDTIEQAIRLDSTNAESYYQKSNLLYTLKRYEEALVVCEQAITLNPGFSMYYLGKGNTLYLLDRYEEALAAYDRAIELDKDFAPAYFNRGAIYYELGRYELAISSYQTTLQFYTRDAFPTEWANVQMRLGDAYSMRTEGSRQDNLERAIACYQAALQVYIREAFPDQWAELQQKLGDTFVAYSQLSDVDNLDNLEKAVEYYEQVSPFELYVDASEVAVENVHQEALFVKLAQEINKFPEKQRTALLIDLADHMAFGNQLTPLQQAFLTAGIRLEDYRRSVPESRQERIKHAALLSVAYKRLRSLVSEQEHIS